MTTEIKTYSSKSTAKRGAKRAGLDLDTNEILQNEEGRWYVSEKGPVVVEPTQEEFDAYYIKEFGTAHCPNPKCGVHLENGVQDYENLLDATDDKKVRAEIKLMKKEYLCLGCGEEFGPDLEAKPEPVKRGPVNKGAVQIVWDICDANVGERRKDVVETCVQAGINFHTAKTQYQKWFTALKACAKEG